MIEPGDSIAGYRIIRLLGAGGMGTVYLASHPRLPRRVALKLLPDHLARDTSFVARFEREAHLGARLNHPAAIHLYDCGSDDGRLWIAMEYVEGETLAERLSRKGPFTPVAALEVLKQIAEAVDHAHEVGLVHRDIKPQNILLADTPDGLRAKLADFGIARELTASETTGAFGTIDYAAPEDLLAKSPTGSPAADIYSLACTAYVMLSGRLPFATHDSLADTLLAHLSEDPPLLSQFAPATVPPAVDEPIASGMAREPAQRPPTAGDFVDSFAAALGAPYAPTPTRARPLLPTSPPRRLLAHIREPTSRKRLVPLAGLVLVLVLVLVVSTILLLQGDSRETRDTTDTPWVSVALDQSSGPITITSRPTRIAALGPGDAEMVAALGHQPVIVSNGSDPRPPLGAGISTEIPTAGPRGAWNITAIEQVHPDLIIDTAADSDPSALAALQRIAPTLTIPRNERVWRWTSRLRWIATAIGEINSATELIAAVDDHGQDIAAQHPEWSDKQIAVQLWDGVALRPVLAPSAASELLGTLGFRYVEDYFAPDSPATDKPVKMIGDSTSLVPSEADVIIVLRTDAGRGGGGYANLPSTLDLSIKPLVVVDDNTDITDLLYGGPRSSRVLDVLAKKFSVELAH